MMGLITQNKATYENILIYLVYFPICLHCFSIIRKKKSTFTENVFDLISFHLLLQFATRHKLVYGLQVGSREKQ